MITLSGRNAFIKAFYKNCAINKICNLMVFIVVRKPRNN